MTTPDDPYQTPQEGEQPPQYGTPPPPDYNAPPPQYNAPPPQWGGAPPQFPGSGGYQMPGAPEGPGGAPLASWGWRALGYLVDFVIILVPTVIFQVATGSRLVGDLVSLILTLVIGYMNGSTGQSPGKRVVGLKVLRESDGQFIGGGMGIVRAIAHILDTIACLVGWFWPLWDNKRQTFADKIIGTVVVKV